MSNPVTIRRAASCVPPTGAGLLRVYRRLLRCYGPQGWWPGETPFEVCVGAVLTQNTAWTQVETALARLRAAGCLEARALARLAPHALAELIRPAGTPNVKARRLLALVEFLLRACDGDPTRLRAERPAELRQRLLAVDGIGPETADALLLYAVGLPAFVVDAYTRRIFVRLGLVGPRDTYAQVQRFFVSRLPADVPLFNDYHAQIVRLAKEACRARPACRLCPLTDLCPRRGVEMPRPRRREVDP
jgi:endonuclease-3 related protein